MITFALIWIGGALFGLLVGSRWPKRKALPAPEPEPRLAFQLVSKLLDRREEWTIQNCTIKHASGLELWTSNRPYGDMHLWRCGPNDNETAEALKAMFTDEEKAVLRAKADKVVRHINGPVSVEDHLFVAFNNWKTDDPEMQEWQQVL